MSEHTLWLASDNRAAAAWATKGSATSLAARSHLLRFNAVHQRSHRYVARHHYIPGPVNAMADDTSRRWDLAENALLTHSNSHSYPQAVSWQMRTPLPATNASLIGALSKTCATIGCYLSATQAPPLRGERGRPSVPAWASNPTGHPTPTTSPSFNSSPSATVTAPSHPGVNLSDLAQWRKPYELRDRRTPDWGPLTLV